MKLLTIFTPLLLAVAVNFSANAELENPHSVGLSLSGGGIDYKGTDTDSSGVVQVNLNYNYQFAPHYSLEAGVSTAKDVDWKCDKKGQNDWDCRSDDNDSFSLDADSYSQDSVIVALKTDLALSKRNSLYAKAGAEFYVYELGLNHRKLADESGVGLYLEAGWEYRWNNGRGVNVGLQHHDLGDIEKTSFSIGISHDF